MAIDLIYLGLMAFVFARPLDTWLAGFPALAGDKSILRLIALFVSVMLFHILVSLPLSFYSNYVVEHQFGLSNQTFRRWLRNYSLSNVLTILLGIALNVGLFWIIWHTGHYWWLIAAAAFFVVSIILGQLPVSSYRSSTKSSPRKPRTSTPAWRLAEVPESKSKASTARPRCRHAKANAMLAGLGCTRRVLMGDTLL
jgi:STE24 endopeptidase